MMKKRVVLFFATVLGIFGCSKYDGTLDNPYEKKDTTATEKINHTPAESLDYIYKSDVIPEIHLTVMESEWNRLLGAYDNDSDTDTYILCDVKYNKDGGVTNIKNAGLRLKGNTSRVRPEGSKGQKHTANSTDWHHCHFQLNFHKYYKDTAHELYGARKMILKWFHNDPSYVREVYCYDLFHRFGIWTASYDAYCRLFVKVASDEKEAYYGVYGMVEPVDENFIKARKEQFGDKDGFLWKCQWGARLNSIDAEMEPDLGENVKRVYQLKTQVDDFSNAKAQLQNLITNLNGLSGDEFHDWIAKVCDVELLLRTYAVSVAVAMWDDYWYNCSNYYLYFNSHDPENYKFWLIPFDYDNTLGTTIFEDQVKRDPFNWGNSDNPLISRIISFDDYRAIYKDALLELVDRENGEFYYTRSIKRIKNWQSRINDYVSNDTGEDMTIQDMPASWGSNSEYRLIDQGNSNFFRVRTEVINDCCTKN